MQPVRIPAHLAYTAPAEDPHAGILFNYYKLINGKSYLFEETLSIGTPVDELPAEKANEIHRYVNKKLQDEFLVKAIRQILYEKNVGVAILENDGKETDAVPMIEHYGGNIVPVDTVILPELIQEDERPCEWSPEALNDGIVLCCEDRGYIQTEIYRGLDPVDGMDWKVLLEAVYAQLADPKKDEPCGEWLVTFRATQDRGIPWPAKALCARLRSLGYSKSKPFMPAEEVHITQMLDLPGFIDPIDHRIKAVWPCRNTVVITEAKYGTEINILDRNSRRYENTWFNCREFLRMKIPAQK